MCREPSRVVAKRQECEALPVRPLFFFNQVRTVANLFISFFTFAHRARLAHLEVRTLHISQLDSFMLSRRN